MALLFSLVSLEPHAVRYFPAVSCVPLSVGPRCQLDPGYGERPAIKCRRKVVSGSFLASRRMRSAFFFVSSSRRRAAHALAEAMRAAECSLALTSDTQDIIYTSWVSGGMRRQLPNKCGAAAVILPLYELTGAVDRWTSARVLSVCVLNIEHCLYCYILSPCDPYAQSCLYACMYVHNTANVNRFPYKIAIVCEHRSPKLPPHLSRERCVAGKCLHGCHHLSKLAHHRKGIPKRASRQIQCEDVWRYRFSKVA